MRGELRFSKWLYGALLHLYPRQFQAAYGQPMRLTFGDACRAAYQRNGARGLLALWLPTLVDLFKSALEERARQGEITMSKSRLIAWAGPLTIVVGVLWLLSAIGSFAFQTGLVREEGLVGLVSLPIFLAFVPLLFALFGTRLRFHASAGALGRLGLALSAAGGAAVILFVLVSILLGGAAPEVAQSLWVNYATALGFVSIRLGYILFGVDALRRRLLPRWNLLPLLVGATVVLSLPFDWFGVPAFVPVQWVSPGLYAAITGTGWALLGLALMDPRRQSQPAAV